MDLGDLEALVPCMAAARAAVSEHLQGTRQPHGLADAAPLRSQRRDRRWQSFAGPIAQ